jgi:asparagine synthase (glutamine-hydrolysing)
MSFPEAVEEYRAVLDSAVRSRLRRRSGRAAVHLSSGYDSSAIAAAAAIESRPERVLAYTAAPPSGFAPQVPKGYSGDESPIAALTAARFDLAHQIVQSSDFTLDYLRRQARLYQEPLRNIINGLWADEIRSAAARAGTTVLLNGMGGNLTLNAGGSYYLSDWLRQKGLAQWFPQAKAAVQQGHVRWRGALFSSVAPLLPPVLWWSIWRRIRPHHATPATFLRREWALSADDLRRRSYGQPGRSTAEDRVEFARMVDPGVHHKGGLADSGVWELEPLTDRRVIEFSLALTPEQLICNGEGRPVARAALKDLLPAEVLDAPRGVQSADWQLHFRQDCSFEILEEIASCESARNLLDIDAMKAAIVNWPDPSSADWRSTTYTSQLPIALTAGVFLKETEAGWHPPA